MTQKSQTLCPALEHNILEALFSQVRGLNRDTAAKYISGLGAINTSNCIKYIENNKCYAPDQVGDIKNDDNMEAVTRRRILERETRIEEWKKTYHLNKGGLNNERVSRFEPNYKNENRLLDEFFSVLTTCKMENSFGDKLMQNGMFMEFAYSSVYTEHDKWFRDFFCAKTG